MGPVIEAISGASSERALVIVLVVVIFFMAYALRELWKRDRAQERELIEIHRLQRELLNALILRRNHAQEDKQVVDEPKDSSGPEAAGEKSHPRPGP